MITDVSNRVSHNPPQARKIRCAMYKLFLHARNIATLVVLGALLTDVSVQAQTSSPRRSRSVSMPSAPQYDLYSREYDGYVRRVTQRCERFILSSELQPPNAQNRIAWSREVCDINTGNLAILYSPDLNGLDSAAAYESCVSAIAPHFRQNASQVLRECRDTQVADYLNSPSARRAFSSCVNNLVTHFSSFGMDDNKIHFYIYSCGSPDRRPIMTNSQNIAAVSACYTFMGEESETFRRYYCDLPEYIRIFSESYFKKMIKECVNDAPTRNTQNRYLRPTCINKIRQFATNVHSNRTFMGIYNDCRAAGYSLVSCIDESVQAYLQTQDRGAREASPEDVVTGAAGATGAGD